jgi:hypothetical protein
MLPESKGRPSGLLIFAGRPAAVTIHPRKRPGDSGHRNALAARQIRCMQVRETHPAVPSDSGPGFRVRAIVTHITAANATNEPMLLSSDSKFERIFCSKILFSHYCDDDVLLMNLPVWAGFLGYRTWHINIRFCAAYIEGIFMIQFGDFVYMQSEQPAKYSL